MCSRVGLLDFQDSVYGDAAYDMVSLLEDARRDVPPSLVAVMLDRYIAATRADRGIFYRLRGAGGAAQLQDRRAFFHASLRATASMLISIACRGCGGTSNATWRIRYCGRLRRGLIVTFRRSSAG